MYTDKNKYRSTIVSSSNVSYQGRLLSFSTDFPCDVNLNEVIAQIDDSLSLLQKNNDFSTLDAKSLNFDPSTANNVDILQALIDETDTLKSTLGDLETAIDDLDIGEEIIEIDLGCLTPDAAACAQGTNRYSLISILTLFKNKLCA